MWRQAERAQRNVHLQHSVVSRALSLLGRHGLDFMHVPEGVVMVI